MTEVFWNRLTAEEINLRAAAAAMVLLPVASTEQHGPHLSTGVDTFLATEGCRRTALKLHELGRPAIVTPTVWMGLAEHHVAFGGTFSLSIGTYHALLRDLCRSIIRANFRRIVIVNGHGGNIAALNALATDLAAELQAPIAITTLYNLAHASGAYRAILEDQKGVLHACEAETSMMQVVARDCVRQERLADAHGTPPEGMALGSSPAINVWRSFKELTASGVLGDARKASTDKGERLLDSAAGLLATELAKDLYWS